MLTNYLHYPGFLAQILTLPALFFKSLSYPVFFLQISYLTRTCSRNFYLLLAFVLQILTIHAHVDEILILRATRPFSADGISANGLSGHEIFAHGISAYGTFR